MNHTDLDVHKSVCGTIRITDVPATPPKESARRVGYGISGTTREEFDFEAATDLEKMDHIADFLEGRGRFAKGPAAETTSKVELAAIVIASDAENESEDFDATQQGISIEGHDDADEAEALSPTSLVDDNDEEGENEQAALESKSTAASSEDNIVKDAAQSMRPEPVSDAFDADCSASSGSDENDSGGSDGDVEVQSAVYRPVSPPLLDEKLEKVRAFFGSDHTDNGNQLIASAVVCKETTADLVMSDDNVSEPAAWSPDHVPSTFEEAVQAVNDYTDEVCATMEGHVVDSQKCIMGTQGVSLTDAAGLIRHNASAIEKAVNNVNDYTGEVCATMEEHIQDSEARIKDYFEYEIQQAADESMRQHSSIKAAIERVDANAEEIKSVYLRGRNRLINLQKHQQEFSESVRSDLAECIKEINGNQEGTVYMFDELLEQCQRTGSVMMEAVEERCTEVNDTMEEHFSRIGGMVLEEVIPYLKDIRENNQAQKTAIESLQEQVASLARAQSTIEDPTAQVIADAQAQVAAARSGSRKRAAPTEFDEPIRKRAQVVKHEGKMKSVAVGAALGVVMTFTALTALGTYM